jgi:5'(3')-deoxyribonucleotidase
LRIALDLDGVTYGWDKTARYMLRRKLTKERRPIPVELFTPSRHWNSIQEAITPEDWAWLWDEAIDLGLYRYGHCVTGAIEGVEALGNLGDVTIVTARPHRALTDTSEWIAFMLNRANIGALLFTDDKHEVEADLFIDDAAHQAVKLHAAGKRVIVFSQRWNEELPESVGTRVYSWPGVIDTVKGLQP